LYHIGNLQIKKNENIEIWIIKNYQFFKNIKSMENKVITTIMRNIITLIQWTLLIKFSRLIDSKSSETVQTYPNKL